jgi:hypothetical protein
MPRVVLLALSAVSVLAFIFAAPPYIIDTLRGKTKPERAAWFIWSVLGVIAFVAQLELGATWSLLFTGLDTAGCILAFLLSLRYGVGGWTLLDKVALGIAASGVVISLAAHAPIVALGGVILADTSGSFLTIRKTFLMPESETTISWLLVSLGALCSLLLVGTLNVRLLLYPAYLFVANASIVLAQRLGRMYYRAKQRRLVMPVSGKE